MEKLKVLYDGKCHVCYREIQHYLKKDKKNLLEAIDISDPNFNASDFGLTEAQVNLELYSIDDSGNVFKAIDSFIEIWKRVPPYNMLIPVFENKFLRKGFDLGYIVFARHIRPNLPKRKAHDHCSM